MKKILVTFLALLCLGALAQPRTVPVVWPFAIGSPQANMIRSMIDVANKEQNKYQFIFVHKPGAGGAVAANFILEHDTLAVLASTSSFYIRPLLYKDSHDVDQFSIASTICTGQPVAIYSKNLPSLNAAKGKEINIGVIPGSITTLVTKSIKRENPEIKIQEIPYKGTPEATTDMLAGHIDGSTDFIGKSISSRFDGSVKIWGITGTKNYASYRTFQQQQIKGLDNVTNDYFMFVSAKTDPAIRQELGKIFDASITERTRALCEDDFGTITTVPSTRLDLLHQQTKARWTQLSQGIVRE